MADCIFCKIANGEIPSTKVYEDEHVLAFRDIHPLAPKHVVIIPKRHVQNLNEIDQLTEAEQLALLHACKKTAALAGIEVSGYRIASNCGPDADQSVQHLHFHVLGGGKLSVNMA
ncbi:MAG: histidine triad nucleotide-binding protein [Clostridia bacterium]|nr:histidine triad nucleotide-binding protein [Clostridia bacterium]